MDNAANYDDDDDGDYDERIMHDIDELYNNVRAKFHDRPNMIDEFTTIMEEYENILFMLEMAPATAAELRETLQDHPDLLARLDRFMPEQIHLQPRLNADDLYSLFGDIEDIFEKKPDVIEKFSANINAYAAIMIQTTKLPGVLGRFRGMFRDHPDLVLRLNRFMPDYIKFEPDMIDAKIFINKVKIQFQHEDDIWVYKCFLNYMNKYMDGRISTRYVQREVKSLFRSRRDLYEEFKFFLPDAMR